MNIDCVGCQVRYDMPEDQGRAHLGKRLSCPLCAAPIVVGEPPIYGQTWDPTIPLDFEAAVLDAVGAPEVPVRGSERSPEDCRLDLVVEQLESFLSRGLELVGPDPEPTSSRSTAARQLPEGPRTAEIPMPDAAGAALPDEPAAPPVEPAAPAPRAAVAAASEPAPVVEQPAPASAPVASPEQPPTAPAVQAASASEPSPAPEQAAAPAAPSAAPSAEPKPAAAPESATAPAQPQKPARAVAPEPAEPPEQAAHDPAASDFLKPPPEMFLAGDERSTNVGPAPFVGLQMLQDAKKEDRAAEPEPAASEPPEPQERQPQAAAAQPPHAAPAPPPPIAAAAKPQSEAPPAQPPAPASQEPAAAAAPPPPAPAKPTQTPPGERAALRAALQPPTAPADKELEKSGGTFWRWMLVILIALLGGLAVAAYLLMGSGKLPF